MTATALRVHPSQAEAVTVAALALTKARRLRDELNVLPAADQWEPLYHQREPDGDWRMWIIRTGRGAGKTEAASHANLGYLRRTGSSARLAVGAPTIADVRNTCAEGESGLITIAPDEFRYNRTTMRAWHKNGGYVQFMGMEEPKRWNGGNWSRVWIDELALARQKSFDEAMMANRKGAAQWILTTTPKASKWVHDLESLPGVVQALTEDGRIPTMYDNPHLSAEAVAFLRDQYEGTDFGRQELMGEWLSEVQGALWKRAWINDFRVSAEDVPPLKRLVLGVDPSGSGSEHSDEAGIVLAGLGIDGHGYVLSDVSERASPDIWANTIADLYDDEQVDLVVAERNYGGEMVEKTIKVAHPSIAYKPVVATRGKEVRAQPVALLYQQGRIHHVGAFPKLEDELVTWQPGEKSPNRMDAMVWAMTELMGISNRYSGWGGHMQRELDEIRAQRLPAMVR